MAALSEVGLVPRLDVLSLEEAERAFPVLEPPDVTPKYLKKLSLEEVLGEGRAGRRREGLSLQGQGRGGGREGELGSELLIVSLEGAVGRLWISKHSGLYDYPDPYPCSPTGADLSLGALVREVELQEPAFKEMLVAYRQLTPSGGSGRGGGRGAGRGAWARWMNLRGLWPGGGGGGGDGEVGGGGEGGEGRRPIQIRIYRDIPVSRLPESPHHSSSPIAHSGGHIQPSQATAPMLLPCCCWMQLPS